MNETRELTLDFITDKIADRQLRELRDIYESYNIVDLAAVTEQLPLTSIIFLFRILPKDISGQLFSYFSNEVRQDLIKSFSDDEIQTMLLSMYSDDMADFISEMPANLSQKILMSVNKEQRNRINVLLSYPENSAGSLMTTEYVELKAGDSLAKALQRIKIRGKAAETISVCYVTDGSKHLVGLIKPEDILFEADQDEISEHMEEHIISCNIMDDQEDVANIFAKYDLDVLPVVNNDNCLIGIITVDDIVDVMQEEVTEDIQRMAAIMPTEGSYLETSVLDMVKSRVPWLLILMLSATFTGMILQNYEDKLMVIPALTAFIPMIMGTSGNAGNQTAVMVIRSIAINEVSLKDTFKVLLKESQIALICGAALFGVALLRIMIFPPTVDLQVALVICLTLAIALSAGILMGAFLPFVSLVFKQDPAATTTPILTTIIDIVSLMVYFELCALCLGI